MNFKDRKPELDEARREALRQVVDVLQMLDAAAVSWMIENPETSELWDTKYTKKVAARAGVTTIKLDSCAFSNPAKKPFRILSNLPSMMLEPLQGHKCSCAGRHEQQSVGKHAKGSGSYTPLLAPCIANVIANAVQGYPDHDDPVMAISQERDAPEEAEGFFEVDSGTSVSVVSRTHVRVLSVDVGVVGVKIKTRGFQSATATAPIDVGTVCVVLTEERTDEEVLGVLHYVAISDHAAGISLLDPVQLHERGFHVDLNPPRVSDKSTGRIERGGRRFRLAIKDGRMGLLGRVPTDRELADLEHVELTSNQPWFSSSRRLTLSDRRLKSLCLFDKCY